MKNKIKIFFSCFLLISVIFSIPGSSDILPNNKVISFNNLEYQIIRDEYGVPHVFAESKEALAFGAGYAIAQDRLWQSDVFRRQATGRMAEIGLATVEYDYWNRLSGYSKQENTELLKEISSPYKEMLEAYTEGINLYISEAFADPINKMPFEYIDRGISPELWIEEDSLAIGQMMVRRWGEGGGNELLFAAVLMNIIDLNGVLKGWKIFNDVCPQLEEGR